jgi:tRNA modification GTPase
MRKEEREKKKEKREEGRDFDIIDDIQIIKSKYPNKKILTIINKVDLLTELESSSRWLSGLIPITTGTHPDNNRESELLFISAKNKTGIDILLKNLTDLANIGALSNNETIVSNSRHFEALNNALHSLQEVQKGLDDNISSDLFAIDIRQALHYLGEITGEITTEDLLGNIFANFCIGK